jgi:hypothetical protein
MRFQQNLLLQKQQVEQEALEEEFWHILQHVSKSVSKDYEYIRKTYNPLQLSATRIEKAHSEVIKDSTKNELIATTKSRSYPEETAGDSISHHTPPSS